MAGPWIAIGEVLAPHGVRGEVRVRPLGSFPERFRRGLAVRLDDEPHLPRRVQAARLHRGGVILKLEGVDDRSQAERLRGARLVVPPGERHPLPSGHFYVDDLVGLRVETAEGRPVGVVVDVEDNPANDLLLVELEAGGQARVPAVKALVRIEVEQGRIVVADLPGLFPDTEGPS